MAGPYRITIYTAMPGTPLVDGNRQIGTSAAGHMWYQVSDGEVKNSYGFAPKEHGASSGPGMGYDSDTTAYQSPAYSRTMEITAEQYAKLRQYGEAALQEDWRYFKGEYKGATNSCVDFTWGALKHAGFNIHRPEVTTHDGTVVSPEHNGSIENHFEGRLQPARNKLDIQQLVDPVPGSPLNSEKSNPPPDRSLLQHLISESETGSPAQRETAQQFMDQLGSRLGLLGMSEAQVNTLAVAAAKEHTRHAGQGEVQSFHLSKDGNTIAMRQAYPPLREFDVNAALGRSEQNHWNEAAALNRGQSGDAVVSRENPGAQFHAAPSQQMDAPVLSRG
jgi:hypothetical protein